jgi:hypothetical protein
VRLCLLGNVNLIKVKQKRVIVKLVRSKEENANLVTMI